MTDEHSPESPPSPETTEAPKPPTPPATDPPKPPSPPAPPTPTDPEPAPAVEITGPVDNYADDYADIEEPAPRDPRLKSPIAAAILALVPFGLGHLYLGQYSRAFTFFIGFWMPILFLEGPLKLVGVFIFFFAVFDAVRQAQLINLAVGSGVEQPASSFSGGIAAGVFLIVLGLVLLLNYHFDLYFIRDFVRDWWPAFLILVGAWFIFGALRERQSTADINFKSDGL